ncbi:SOS response-associated peptidase [Streptomyces sp. XM4193]|uniref:SOS response-associated peptidase n=1 Tax=Streptomyces sp. XM4193 TaxID=2929782 RepID=UPI001FF8FC2F|nr:SOS response-associated peptidase [Streptomyces sp. XM4193]MCK1797370.1 SOS response-associated peptidase [Streptomyces sp. XM4193]
MCGRYAASQKPEDLVRLFDVSGWDPQEALAGDHPNYNVAPTDRVLAVLDRPLRHSEDPTPVRQLRELRWGLVPSWAKSPESGVKMINARSETVAEKPAYRRAFLSRRCLLPADGYYEWVTASGELDLEQQGKRKRPRKQPYFVTPVDGSVMAFAGLYEFWRDPSVPQGDPSAWWATCTVLTTEAETDPLPDAAEGGPRSLADIHPRMPVALPADRWDSWLDPRHQNPDELRELTSALPAGRHRAYPVGTAVSNVRNNGPQLKDELAEPELGTLF